MSDNPRDFRPDEAHFPRCENCKQCVPAIEATKLGADPYCPDCLDYIGFRRCANCGQAVPKDEAVRSFNEKLKCIEYTHRACPEEAERKAISTEVERKQLERAEARG